MELLFASIIILAFGVFLIVFSYKTKAKNPDDAPSISDDRLTVITDWAAKEELAYYMITTRGTDEDFDNHTKLLIETPPEVRARNGRMGDKERQSRMRARTY